MKSHYLHFLLISLISSQLLACAFTPSELHYNAPKDIVQFGVFQKDAFIPDEKPLSQNISHDLREIALSLPIWDGGWINSEQWIYKNSSSGIDSQEWAIPADGAQISYNLRRLHSSEDGAIRVELRRPSSKLFTPSGGRYLPWTAIIRRTSNGWIIESNSKTII
ncbi:hypothetical protein HNR46_000103 [Haloferula luteola]|uniref:Lipoprotein n=1 Tax=Haloferula luteola TaxID=595692 RepID=A0A840UVS1_9BACT|nr:hypothetical protein [Haloferula luteola]MBB5349882.1 hypothetical protein [Haloferula luteola]